MRRKFLYMPAPKLPLGHERTTAGIWPRLSHISNGRLARLPVPVRVILFPSFCRDPLTIPTPASSGRPGSYQSQYHSQPRQHRHLSWFQKPGRATHRLAAFRCLLDLDSASMKRQWRYRNSADRDKLFSAPGGRSLTTTGLEQA